jgi:uncharacterized protein (TIGR01619 family)
MPSGWNSYLCNVNDNLASILLNLDLRGSAPDAAKPHLLWVWVYFQHPRPDGLSSREEFDTLNSIQDKLTASIEQRCRAILSGRVTTDGHREFYFYASDPRPFEEAVKESMASFEGYKFDFDQQEDPDWDQYLNVLFPSDEDLQRIANREVLEALKRNGDALQSPREILHWAYFKTENDRSDFRNSAQTLGYRVDSESEFKEKNYPYAICVGKEQDIQSDALDDAVIDLFRAAKSADGDYDGWESPVVTS